MRPRLLDANQRFSIPEMPFGAVSLIYLSRRIPSTIVRKQYRRGEGLIRPCVVQLRIGVVYDKAYCRGCNEGSSENFPGLKNWLVRRRRVTVSHRDGEQR
ncbi:hypothetical protein NPIL_582001 [Nephila pilipes]|uniref:Uncharacterized protein n=1 Tax=Nephila pilipes TaxID=299642 RepID=A0A8X6Q5U8_NEPPI|nr:hypothetical protein NPIL_582001 [Nephila pilipes]